MKLTLISDIHDDYESFAKAVDYSASKETDLILVLGDFILKPYKKEDIEEFKVTNDQKTLVNKILNNMEKSFREAKNILDSSKVPYFAIPGNYDGKNFESVFKDKSLHLKSLEDPKIFGYGGADAFASHLMPFYFLLTDYDPRLLYDMLATNVLDIIMLHNPPYGLCDNRLDGSHAGVIEVTEYLKIQKPKLIAAGHIHEAGPLGNNPNNVKGVAKLNDTIVVNPGNVGRVGFFKAFTLEELLPVERFDYGTFSEVEIGNKVKRVVHYSIRNPEKNSQVRKLEEVVF